MTADKLAQAQSEDKERLQKLIGKHVCLDYHIQKGASWAPKSLFDDACDLMRARHLVVAWSTFPESMALMSTRVQTLYHSGPFTPFGGQGADWCTDSSRLIWNGTRLHEYELGKDFKLFFEGDPKKALLTYPSYKIRHRPLVPCSMVKMPADEVYYLNEDFVNRTMDGIARSFKNDADKASMKRTHLLVEVDL